MRELISHRFSDNSVIPLERHLACTGLRARALVKGMPLNLSLGKDDLAMAAFITGVCHDFGKAKKQFQEYISKGKWVKGKEHAVVSSIITYLVARELFRDQEGISKYLPFVCSYAVNRHHSPLVNLDEAFSRELLEDEYLIARNKINEEIWDLQFELSGNYIKFGDFRSSFLSLDIDKIAFEFEMFRRELREEAETLGAESGSLVDLYLALLTVISALTESDPACVVWAPTIKPSIQLPTNKIDSYVSTLEAKGSLNFRELRESAWRQVRGFVPHVNTNILRLTLPTGMGKTLMGLHLAARLQKDEGLLIYSLPYLSIIEQVGEVARSVFCTDPHSLRVMQYHSLTLPEPKGEEEKTNFEQLRFAMEDWDSDIVVTTFDQLFYSFLSGQRSFIRRFWRLAGSTIVLDEVQTVPARILPLIEALLKKMSEKLNLKIIYMTATKPPFLKHAATVIHGEEGLFEKLGRTRMVLRLREGVPFQDYIRSIPRFLEGRKKQSTMFVANTVGSSLQLFDYLTMLKDTNPQFDKMHLSYISGAVAPIERIRRINSIRRLKEGDFAVIVATQCVEAGVDIDVDEIVRDFAPWDSLMQVCGRANRYESKPCSTVWVYRWIDDASQQNREFSSYVYDKVLLDATLSILKNRNELSECDYYGVQNQYLQELEDKKRLTDTLTRKIISNTLAWKFGEIDEFRRLFREGDTAKLSVFCIADEASEELKDIGILLWGSKDSTSAIKKLEELVQSRHFRPLADFLKTKSEYIAKAVREIKMKDDKTRRLQLQQILQPLFHAYTISVTQEILDKAGEVGFLSEGFPYLDRAKYDTISGKPRQSEAVHRKNFENIF